MNTIYQKYWDNLQKEKQDFWGMGSETTKELSLIYPLKPDPLIGFLPIEIKKANEVIEEDNYFIFNGKKKVRKIPFLSQLLLKRYMPETESTSGRLFLTIDPEWILRCSDKTYTSWESCFAPDGCYHFSAKEYTTSINIAMAMITNSDMTKMIGRKFVIIPSRNSDRNIREAIVFFARHYGTFPIHYQRSLSAYIAESIFGSSKNNWSIKSDQDAIKDEESKIYVKEVENIGNSRFKSDRGKSIWFDDSAFVLRKKDANIENAYISFDSNENDNEVLCDYCVEYVYEEDTYEVYYNDYCDIHRVCSSCLYDIAVYDEFEGVYIYLDDAIEYWHVNSYGISDFAYYTYKSQIERNLFAIRVIGGIKYGEFWDSELLYVDNVPNSCIEYNGEYLCVDIRDTDNSAILELIKELEGEDDEDEEKPEEIAVEAADE